MVHSGVGAVMNTTNCPKCGKCHGKREGEGGIADGRTCKRLRATPESLLKSDGRSGFDCDDATSICAHAPCGKPYIPSSKHASRSLYCSLVCNYAARRVRERAWKDIGPVDRLIAELALGAR